MNYLPRLALNHDPPDCCLLRSWDYRREPQEPVSIITLFPQLPTVPKDSTLTESINCRSKIFGKKLLMY
jgi:hypothetical protein